jgi:hypothetical protein
MTIKQMFLMQTQAVQVIGQTLAAGAAAATPTSTSDASADATNAQGQADIVHEGISPCLCPSR